MKTKLNKSCFRLLSGLAILSVMGFSTQAKAYNAQACVENPLTEIPRAINLLQPIDQKMINCIPGLDEVGSRWRTQANRVQSLISQVKIGNNGNAGIEKLEYNVTGNTINLVARVQARHTWNINVPAVTAMVPVDRYRWVDVPYPDVRFERHCNIFGCARVPIPFTNTRRERVVYVVNERRTIMPARTVSQSASTTCTYDYTFNVTTTEGRPIFSCGQGSLGAYKLDATALNNILNGEMPDLAALVTAVSITPPLIKDQNFDTYDSMRDEVIASHPDSIVYFSSNSFVQWASVERHGVNILASVVTGGSYGSELLRQIEERMRGELVGITATLSKATISLGVEQIIGMLTGAGGLNLNGYTVSLKSFNVPVVMKKCIQSTGDCTPGLEAPRLGFAIIATPIN